MQITTTTPWIAPRGGSTQQSSMGGFTLMSNPYKPLKYHSDRKGTPFVHLLLTKYGTTPFTYLFENFVSLFNC